MRRAGRDSAPRAARPASAPPGPAQGEAGGGARTGLGGRGPAGRPQGTCHHPMGPLPLCAPIMLPLLLMLVPGLEPSAASQRSHVHRRGLLELAGTMDCVGTRSPIAYINYGCYCGLGGHGQPRDTIDWCCHRHDCCYTRAEEAGCEPKIERYSWQCVDQRILCGPAENKCQELLCKCDQEIAYCLAQTEYNLRHLLYPHFLCEKDSPKCS
ncbi:group 10 secretory phospholipase A2 [Manis pentadactyla]|uniref:group 10 secretory phospholipase A2 n=1 Tax=Manis pentadactyla TaxID=143292 RepID=UPI00255CE994|nr:group 10 secretory phospholipase A2 [Manis pentadactyla]KAI5212301.1 Group 10 Secretory Phospholipase A2 [Manis pentadactyla]